MTTRQAELTKKDPQLFEDKLQRVIRLRDDVRMAEDFGLTVRLAAIQKLADYIEAL
jgi:hypothetical protein